MGLRASARRLGVLGPCRRGREGAPVTLRAGAPGTAGKVQRQPEGRSIRRMDMSPGPLNAMTVDVEDYFHVEAFARQVSRDRWDEYPLRVERNTHRLLDLFDRHEVKATFFVLGWVARKLPGLVLEIA